jgi:Na+/melibiose symporter-like transporter
LSILLRLSMATFDVPARTLVAELTADYDERTKLASLPISASWFIGAVVAIAMYGIWLKDSAEFANGQTNIAGYQQAAVVLAAFILASLLLSTIGLHREIPRLHRKTSEQHASLKDLARSFAELLQIPSLRALLMSSLFVGIGLGATAALWMYQYGFFYGMSSEQMSMMMIVEALASLAVASVVRRYVVEGDKRIMAIRFLGASVAISMILPPLLLLGLIPARGSTGLWWFLAVYDFVSQLVWIVTASIIYSLYADVTDEAAVQTGKRLEGVILAYQSFTDKAAAALGALLAGLVLTLIDFPVSAEGAVISDEALARLGLSYMAVWFVLASSGIWFVSRYRITRSSHAAEVEALEKSEQRTGGYR